MAPKKPTINFAVDPKPLVNDGKTPVRVRGKRHPKSMGTLRLRKLCVDASKDATKGHMDVDENNLVDRIVDNKGAEKQKATEHDIQAGKFWVEANKNPRLNYRPRLRLRYKPQTTNKKPSKLSRLESLPTELIEQIFVECLEINLPRASPHIASLLSNPRLYRLLTIYAFWNDPQPNDKATDGAVAKVMLPIKYKPLDLLEKKKLQQAVLSSSWCTLRHVQSCFTAMVELSVARGEYLEWYDGLVETEPDRIAEKIEYILPSWYADEIRGHILTKPSRDFLAPSFPGKPMYPLRVLTLPDKVINGKRWTSTKTNFFKYLRSFMVPIKGQEPPGVPFSQDLLNQGIHTAIMDDNYDALAALLELEEHCCRTTSFSLQLEDKVRERPVYRVREEHFLTVVRKDLNPEIFKTLLRANAESVPYDNHQVTGWAMRLYKTHPDLSKWLLDLMTDIPKRRRDVEEGKRPLFSCGLAGVNKLGCDNKGRTPCRGACRCQTTIKAFGKSAYKPWVTEIANVTLPYVDNRY